MPSNKLLKEKKHLEVTSHYIAEKKKKNHLAKCPDARHECSSHSLYKMVDIFKIQHTLVKAEVLTRLETEHLKQHVPFFLSLSY